MNDMPTTVHLFRGHCHVPPTFTPPSPEARHARAQTSLTPPAPARRHGHGPARGDGLRTPPHHRPGRVHAHPRHRLHG
ncbi:protein of unknown function [Streptomyces murinus]